ncbi:Bacterial Transmembrane Pair family protein [compost metagenome]
MPVAAWMLDISLWQALMVELGFFVIILPYTVVYNWAFDQVRHWITQRWAAA